MLTHKPPLWADLLLTVWVIVVGVIYYGGYFIPAIRALTASASALYALMVLVSVLALALRYLRPGDSRKAGDDESKDRRTKKRK